MNTPEPFRHIGVAGLGLIGGSVALAARQRFPGALITGCDNDACVAAARTRGAVTAAVTDPAHLADCDLIVVAVPLADVPATLAAIAASGTRALVTDVGSTKRTIVAAARACDGLRFVGGHPMAGRERPGLAHAAAELFVDRPWLLVKGTADAAAEDRIEAFVRALGARPAWMEADAHDRAVAFVSHLPQILGAALMTAADAGVGDVGPKTAGPAFAEMTRLASSPPAMWTTVLADNAEFVAEALRRFAADLPTAETLRSGAWVQDVLVRAGAARDRWQRRED